MNYSGIIAALGAIVIFLGCGGGGVDLDQCLTATQFPDSIPIAYNESVADTAWTNRVNGEYDEFADSTTLSTASFMDALVSSFGTSSEEGLTVTAALRCAGQGLCRPDSLRLQFQRTGEERAIPDSAQIIFLLDSSQRVRVGRASVTAGRKKTLIGRAMEGRSARERAEIREETDDPLYVVQERATASASFRQLARIACSDSVRYTVGEREGTLDDETLKRLRLLIALADGRVALTGL